MNRINFGAIFILLGFAVACGGGSMGTPPSISLSLSGSSITAFQSQSAVTDSVTVSRVGTSGNVTVTLSGLPTGATVQITSPGSGNSGSLSIDPGTAVAGTYPLTVLGSDGTVTGSVNLSLTIGVTAQIANVETAPFSVAMSTSFQPAEWDDTFFINFPAAATPLNNLGSQHIRLQPISQGVPQKADKTWDFSTLDAILNPVIGTNDDSPELQLATAPTWMDDSSGHILPTHFSDFASYAADMVLYYNTTTGFTDSGGMTHVHSNPATPVTYWGMFNEPNINGLNVSQYTQLYNVTVPAMQAADSNIKFVAVELSDGYNNWEQNYMPTFVNVVTAKVDVLATHFYSSCNQKDSDQQLMATVPGFASGVAYIYSQLATKPTLANVPVWITENNVNADFDAGNGISQCNGTKFVTDARGSSAFFAAWRPLMFSQVGKAGAQALYQWVFAGDAQYGELDDSNGNPRLSYWVDYWLEHLFPSTAGANLLQFSSTDNSDIEILAVRNADSSVVVMVDDYAIANATDNNGPGAPRTVSVDVSALGTFTSGSLLSIDASTNLTTGPTPTMIAPASTVQITFNGYGVAFLKLQP